MKLWRSGIILSAVGLFVGLANYAFQAIIGRQLDKAEFGYVNSTLGFVNFLSLPLSIVAASIVHYIAHFRATNDDARLQGLLSGCRQFLLKVTIIGSIAAAVLTNPLSRFFEFPRNSLMLAALACVLFGLWSGFAVALCQGMSWFKRMAFIGLIAALMRLAFGWIATKQFPTAEVAVSATTFSLIANFALLYWWKDLFKTGQKISPWNREFLSYLIVATANVGGTYFFTQGDVLVAQKYFHGDQLGFYTAAGVLGRALTALVGPMLIVLFTSRSGHKAGAAVADQKIMLVLYGAGLICGALGLIILRQFLVRIIFGKYTPEAAEMVIRFAVAMVFVGLVQAIGTWSLASRWFKLAIGYGVLGLSYWAALLLFGKSPAELLQLMIYGSLIAFVILLAGWFITIRNTENISSTQ